MQCHRETHNFPRLTACFTDVGFEPPWYIKAPNRSQLADWSFYTIGLDDLKHCYLHSLANEPATHMFKVYTSLYTDANRFLFRQQKNVVVIACERGNSRDAWSAVDILWRLHFSRVRPAPARITWYQLGPVENENIASHIHDKYYLYYSIMPKIKINP